MSPHRSSRSPAVKSKSKSKARPAAALPVLRAGAAGIDVHAAEHWVCVPADRAAPAAGAKATGPAANVCSFGACTADLEQLADWLGQCGVTTVAMESTGIYWVPLFELLERRGFEVFLVDPRQTRQVAGRPKTDVLDCQWIQRLHACGLLAPSFRPSDEVCVLRGYLRQRQTLIADAGRQVQHVQKALEQMNVKLTEVVSDIVGLTGMLILKAIARGVRDPHVLAKYRHANCHATEAQIAAALQGSWRDEHLFAFKQALKLYEHYQRLVAECDAKIEACLKTFADHSGGEVLAPKPGRRRGRRPNDLSFDARGLLFGMSGVDLTAIEGIDAATALVILSEIGTDLSRFPSAKHFVSWLGLCPQHQGSAGRIKSRRLRGGANRAARALRMAGQGCHHAKHALGAFYRRIQARCGGTKAVVATARKIAERVYRLLRHGQAYERRGQAEYEAAYRRKLTKGLARKATELGYRLVPLAEAAQP
jgi:transposase